MTRLFDTVRIWDVESGDQDTDCNHIPLCWEAHTPDYPSCSGYASAGYTCVGNWCAAFNPRGLIIYDDVGWPILQPPSFCAEKKVQGYVVDHSTGRCVEKISDGDGCSSNSLIKTLKGHTDRVTGVSFSPNNQYVVSGSDDKTVRIWNVDSILSFWITSTK